MRPSQYTCIITPSSLTFTAKLILVTKINHQYDHSNIFYSLICLCLVTLFVQYFHYNKNLQYLHISLDILFYIVTSENTNMSIK